MSGKKTCSDCGCLMYRKPDRWVCDYCGHIVEDPQTRVMAVGRVRRLKAPPDENTRIISIGWVGEK